MSALAKEIIKNFHSSSFGKYRKIRSINNDLPKKCKCIQNVYVIFRSSLLLTLTKRTIRCIGTLCQNVLKLDRLFEFNVPRKQNYSAKNVLSRDRTQDTK